MRQKRKQIVIDRSAGLVFDSEKELYGYFQPFIEKLEQDFDSIKLSQPDIEVPEEDLNQILDMTLDEPAEIWHDSQRFKEFPLFYFIRPLEDLQAFHVAVTYVSDEDEPTFIFLHFVSRDLDLVGRYRKGDLVYDKAFEEISFGAIEGDSLSEADPLAMGLFLSMLKLRSDSDIPFAQFKDVGLECREATIEDPDEIWRSSVADGRTLVTFIKEFEEHELRNLSYIVVTLEDSSSQVHTLLYSFPTVDEHLVDRYRHGENLQADEVVQESSH